MEDFTNKDEVNFKEIFNIIWEGKKLIFLVSLIFSLSGIFYSLSITNLYKSSALMQIKEVERGSNLMGSGLSGLASLAGISLSSSGSNKIFYARDYLKSRELFKDIISDDEARALLLAGIGFDKSSGEMLYDKNSYDPLKKQWHEKVSEFEAHQNFLSNVLKIEIDFDSQFILISVSHFSPYSAKYLAELIVKKTNANIRRKDIEASLKAISYLEQKISESSYSEVRNSLNNILEEELKTQMLSNIRDDYFFSYIQKPQVMENKFYPRRSFICVAFALVGFFGSLLFLIFRYYLFSKRN